MTLPCNNIVLSHGKIDFFDLQRFNYYGFFTKPSSERSFREKQFMK